MRASVALALGAFVLGLVSSSVALAYVLAELPPDALCCDGPWLTSTTAARRWGRLLLGVVLVLAGVIMALPGVPGQGLLTVLAGLLLLDLPGQRAFLRRRLAHPGTFRTVNRLREKLGKPPLAPPGSACG